MNFISKKNLMSSIPKYQKYTDRFENIVKGILVNQFKNVSFQT